jgi:hypothetical protein
MNAGREEIVRQLGQLLRGDMSSSAFMDWLSRVEAGLAEIPADDAALIAAAINLFEDASINEERRLVLAERYLSCVDSGMSNQEVSDLLPLVFLSDRLCSVVDRWKRGIVDRQDFSAFVRNTRIARAHREWLFRATPEALSYLCRQLTGGDYAEVIGLMRT